MARPKSFKQAEALEKAMQLFWEKGFEATSIQDLVDAIGINRQSLYNTFGDKKQLFLQSLDLYRTRGLEGILQQLAEDKPVQQKIADVFRFIIDASIYDSRGCLIANSTLELANHDDDVATIVCDNLENYEAAFKQVLLEAQQRGELSSDKNPDALARYLFSSLQGIRVTAKATNDRARLEDIAAITLSVLS
ncbi:MAG: TetR/AcrR family transcriptional regulator [Deinococcota bacterium]